MRLNAFLLFGKKAPNEGQPSRRVIAALLIAPVGLKHYSFD
jgi:hypothetical protein